MRTKMSGHTLCPTFLLKPFQLLCIVSLLRGVQVLPVLPVVVVVTSEESLELQRVSVPKTASQNLEQGQLQETHFLR